jgi:hypothetical protein
MKRIVPFLLMLSLVPVITGCDKSDEVPPVTDTLPTGYRLPDPQTLSDDDRAAIAAEETEYNNNTK